MIVGAFGLIPSIIALSALINSYTLVNAAQYSVRITSASGVVMLSDVPNMLDKPLEPVHMGNGDTEVMAATPREYLTLIAAGYELQPPCSVYLDSIRQAETLAALISATSSRVSFLQDFTLAETNILSVLPMDIHANWDDYTDAVSFDDYELSGLVEREKLPRFKYGFPRAYVESMSDTKVVFRNSDESETWISGGVTNSEPTYVRFEVELLAWGDFNADGIEDILISNRQDWIPGTISMVTIEKLTRLSPSDPLVIIGASGSGD